MVTEAAPYGRKTQKAPPVKDVHIVWITAGLGCDGDSVSITAATQPSIEDVLLGRSPGSLRCTSTTRCSRTTTATTSSSRGSRPRAVSSTRSSWWSRDRSPTRSSTRQRRLLGGGRHRPGHGAADHHQRVDRPAGAQGAGGRRGRHVCDLRRDPRHAGQPDGRHGPGRLPGLGLQVGGGPAHRQRPRLSRPARQLHGGGAVPPLPGGGLGAGDPARRAAAADLAVRQDRFTTAATAARYYEQGEFAKVYGSP